jgi:four helix bundle protein
METSSFRDLRVWQQAIELAMAVYQITGSFPKHELYGLSQQMRRAAVSVASNIAEGKGRRYDKEFRQFLFHARGSLLELETQLTIAAKLEYLASKDSNQVQALATQVGRSLAGLVNSLTAPSA